ncbi:MAG: hypothetical protein P1U34_07585 [Coxiellaceae bacterium]|nr:hypothetical protein [Coxiellaceae bacterium]
MIVQREVGDTVVVDVAEKTHDTKYYAEFKQAVQGTMDHIDSGRGVSDAMMVLAVLAIGGVASYQSLSFAKSFVARVLGPDEANAPALLQDWLPLTSGVSAYTANAAIPVISSDVALITTANILACLLSGIASMLTLGSIKALVDVRKKHEWNGVTAFGYSLLVLGLSIAGSVANTEAAHDSVKQNSFVWMLAVTVCSAIVQLLQNARAVKLLLCKDTSHLKKYRLEQQAKLLPEAERKRVTEEKLHAMSMGQQTLLPMPVQVGVLIFGLVASGLYNYASAIQPILKNNPDWSPVWKNSLAGINFLVKTVLLTRATTNQSRRILTSKNWNGWKVAGLVGLTLFGMLSIGGASEYPKKYLFEDDKCFEHSMMSMALAEAACLALNLGDMYDAGKIILGFMYNKVLMQWMLGRRPDPKQRYGATFTDLIHNSMQKTMGQDESHYFHHREYERGHDHDDHEHEMVAVSSKPRNGFMTSCNLQAAYQPQNINMDFVAMGGSEYHVKAAGEMALDSWALQDQLRTRIFGDIRQALPEDMPTTEKDAAARKGADEKLNDLYQQQLDEISSAHLSPRTAA